MRRRGALGLLAAGGLALAGCTDPTVHGSPSSRPSGTAGPLASTGPDPLRVAAGLELALARQAVALGRITADPEQRSRCTLLAAAHQAHANALTGPHPADRTGGSAAAHATASPTVLAPLGPDRAKALNRLGDQESAAATTYRGRVTAAGAEGPDAASTDALLWASLSVSAAIAARAVAARSKPPAAPVAATAPPPSTSPVGAVQQLLAQVHAVRYAYRQAEAGLSGTARHTAASELADRTRLRDSLIAILQVAKESVPAAEPAYTVPIRPDTAARARRLLCTVDVALLPFLGQWLAADAAHRAAALTALGRSATSSVGWGGGPLTWPGYP